MRTAKPLRRPIVAVTVVVAALAPSTASAAVFNVNTTTDQADAAQDGVCDASATTAGQQCTLRAAVREANVNTALDQINLPAGTFPLNSQVAVTSTVEIDGAGARTTAITGGSLSFAGACTGGVAGLCSADLSDLTVRSGGGVTSRSHLGLTRVTVRDNTKGPSTGMAPFGGGVFVGAVGAVVSSNLTIADSTISGNRVVGFPSFLPNGMGGGVAIVSTGTVTVTNTTVVGNTATGEDALGGGIGFQMANVSVRSSTIDGNTATATVDLASGGNLYRTVADDMPQPGTLVLTDSIVSGGSVGGPGINEGQNCSTGAVTSQTGRNIDSGASCGLAAPSLSSTDPMLGALGDIGGPTDVRLPAESSPAFNAALGTCPAADQRGVTRPQGSACDIGAVEREVAGDPGDPGDPGGDPGDPGGDPGDPGGDPTDPGGDPGDPGGDLGDPTDPASGDGDPHSPGDGGPSGGAETSTGACVRAMTGTARPNVLMGSPFGDRIRGGRGNDRLVGRAGDDCLSGQAGSDRVSGGSGNDVLSGGGGKDRLVGGRGVDVLSGGAGSDVLSGGAGSDVLDARGGGADVVTCGGGRDRVKADRSDRIKRGCERVAVR